MSSCDHDDRPFRDQIRGAFDWLSEWESKPGYAQSGEEDQSAHAQRVLGERAYRIICDSAAKYASRARS